jgi:hypothetical protein
LILGAKESVDWVESDWGSGKEVIVVWGLIGRFII